MDLALDNLQRLICHKTRQTDLKDRKKDIFDMLVSWSFKAYEPLRIIYCTFLF